MIELRDEDYCSECSSVLRSDEKERKLCEVCFYYPDEEEDFLVGKTCNPDAPEECESCQ